MDRLSHKFGNVVSAARKEIGLTQYELCKQMGLSQSNLSKIESNLLKPPADVWIDFCEMFEIPFDSYRMGYIDSGERKGIINGKNKNRSFSIPRYYQENSILRVRFLIPIFENLKMLFGVEAFYSAIHEMEVDAHLLNIRDTLVNFRFVADLLKKFELSVDQYDFIKVAEMAAHDFVHGRAWSRISGKDVVKSSAQIVKKIDLYLNDYYIRQEIYANSQSKLIIPPFPSRPSFLDNIGLVEQINFNYLPNFIRSIIEINGQVQFLDEGPTFQIYIKGIN